MLRIRLLTIHSAHSPCQPLRDCCPMVFALQAGSYRLLANKRLEHIMTNLPKTS